MTAPYPFISIVIPTHNRAPFIRAAIHSALGQDYDHFEVVVVDDGSMDHTESVLKVISDPRLRLIRKPHSGAPDTRNHGIRFASGDFILWLDSDDALLPNVLGRYAETVRRYTDADVVYGDLEIYDELGNRRRLTYPDHWSNPNLFALLIKGNIIPNGGSLVRKDLYRKAGPFDTGYVRAHDYEFWTRGASLARFKHVGAMTYRWLWHGANMSAENQTIDRSYEANIVDGLAARVPFNQLFPDLDWTDPDAANAEAHGRIAVYLVHWKADAKAAAHVETALAYDPHCATALEAERRLRSRGASFAGQTAYAEQDYSKALACFKLAVDIDPENAQACNNQAVVYAVTGDRANAMRQCAAALKIAPNDLDLYYNVAKILVSIDQIQSAASLCAAVLERDPFAATLRDLLRNMHSLPQRDDANVSRVRPREPDPGLSPVLSTAAQ